MKNYEATLIDWFIYSFHPFQMASQVDNIEVEVVEGELPAHKQDGIDNKGVDCTPDS